MFKRTSLAAVALAVLLAPAVARASGGEALVWEETRQEIPNGGEISLWEQFNLEGGHIPQCQAEVAATLVTNGQSTDDASGPASVGWSECGSFGVSGGFTSLEFDPQKITATAMPAISITEPGGCVYSIAKVEGAYSAIGPETQAVWQFTGTASLSHGTPCSAELHLEGVIELFPRGAGSPLPWRSLEAIEKEGGEKEFKRKAEEEAAAKNLHEREAEVLTLKALVKRLEEELHATVRVEKVKVTKRGVHVTLTVGHPLQGAPEQESAPSCEHRADRAPIPLSSTLSGRDPSIVQGQAGAECCRCLALAS